MIPSAALVWQKTFDPGNRDVYYAGFGPDLEAGEIVTSAAVTLLPEAVAMGLTIIEDAQHGPWIANDTFLELWFEIPPEMRDDPAFESGANLPVTIIIITSGLEVETGVFLPRRLERTFVLKAKQQ